MKKEILTKLLHIPHIPTLNIPTYFKKKNFSKHSFFVIQFEILDDKIC